MAASARKNGAKSRWPDAEVTTVVLADVDVAQPVAHQQHRSDEVVLLDVHVVRVEVDQHVVGADVVGQAQRVVRRC